ncbi:MAG: 16S rRNA (uracil(1498)-N(3))-methyltransferase [Sedimentisphaerales bacterium]|nr:16S rRNA (uracil(1498)-N(3))-methyltransferase [Sedimentisphaerales bacterium]
MRTTRCFCEKIETSEVIIRDAEAHHLIHVLRVETGTQVELFDGKGTVAQAIVEKAERKEVLLSVTEIVNHEPRMGARVVLAVSVAKGNRFDQIVTQCTELGVDHIAAVLFERTVKQAAGSATDRWKKLAVSAAKQSGRIFLPQITGPADLPQTLEQLKAEYPEGKIIYGGFSRETIPIGDVIGRFADTIAFVGPEGGLTESEQKLLQDAGAMEVKLTQTILRIETAALAFGLFLCLHRDSMKD